MTSDSNPSTPENARPAPRTEVNCPAWIDFRDGSPVENCTVVNLSRTGAKLSIPFRQPLPETFVLRLSADGAIAIVCKTIWAREGAVGVQFLKRVDDAPSAKSVRLI
jgi:hypothetical protein